MIAVVILLAGRVWWLEARLRRVEVGWLDLAMRVNEKCDRSVVSEVSAYNGRTYRQVVGLASALGYEWKRTDAKEGWEKKPAAPFGFGIGGMTAYRKALEDSIAAPIWVRGGCNPNGHVGDRRKADRRKPALTYTANAQGADGKVRKVPSKKPRRAH